MTTRRCPVPNCTEEVPAKGVFCLDHYFQLPQKETAFIFRMKHLVLREEDPEQRSYLREQLDGYVNAAVRHLTEGGCDAA